VRERRAPWNPEWGGRDVSDEGEDWVEAVLGGGGGVLELGLKAFPDTYSREQTAVSRGRRVSLRLGLKLSLTLIPGGAEWSGRVSRTNDGESILEPCRSFKDSDAETSCGVVYSILVRQTMPWQG
jgi:hypothetical protein